MGVSRSIRKQDKNKREKDGEAKAAAPKKRKQKTEEASEKAANKRRLTGIILVFIFFLGLCVALYPLVSAYINEKHATKMIIDYEASLKNMKPEDYTAFFNSAEAYNRRLFRVRKPFLYYDEAESCAAVLSADAASPPAPKPGEYRAVADSGAVVRSKPAINADTATTIPKNMEFTVSEIQNNWGKVSYNGRNGWCCLKDYSENLNAAGTGIMGYISIDKIKVELPIYHTVTPQVLLTAAGHMPGSSLPVGGESTHCVLLAHRGLPSALLFTHLDRLEVGDNFRITIFDRVLTYEVDQIRIVEPGEVDDLYIVPGEDLCTLVTCTPYGINTHRMLVRGKRIETVMPKPDVYVPNEAFIIDPLIVAPAVAMPMLFVLLIALMVKYSKRNKKPTLEQAENIVEASENLKNTENPETAGNSEDIEKNPEKREEQGGKDEQNE